MERRNSFIRNRESRTDRPSRTRESRVSTKYRETSPIKERPIRTRESIERPTRRRLDRVERIDRERPIREVVPRVSERPSREPIRRNPIDKPRTDLRTQRELENLRKELQELKSSNEEQTRDSFKSKIQSRRKEDFNKFNKFGVSEDEYDDVKIVYKNLTKKGVSEEEAIRGAIHWNNQINTSLKEELNIDPTVKQVEEQTPTRIGIRNVPTQYGDTSVEDPRLAKASKILGLDDENN